MIAHPKIDLCCQTMRSGGVIAYPTEAVWGLGCDPFNTHAVQKILAMKKRHWRKGLILVASEIDQFSFLINALSAEQQKKLGGGWPEHTTYLVEHNDRLSKFVRGDHSTIALRVSQHPVVSAICNKFGGPIVSTSANPQALLPARSGYKARDYFSQYVVVFAPGTVGMHNKPSRIIDLATGQIIR